MFYREFLHYKNKITDKAADDIATAVSCNNRLQELDINDNELQTTGAVTISKALQKISTLTKLYISKNNITDKAADAPALSCNAELQEPPSTNMLKSCHATKQCTITVTSSKYKELRVIDMTVNF